MKPLVSRARVPLDESGSLDGPDIEFPENVHLDNRVVSACGRFESYDFKDYHFEIDWNEIASSGSDDEPEIPHEEVMREMEEYALQLRAQR